jgi:hypothetical protein
MSLTRLVSVVLLLLLVSSLASAQLPMIGEAEECTIKCGAGSKAGVNIWARRGHTTPDFWGKAAGDSISWSVTFQCPHDKLKLGVRYSFNEPSYKAGHPVNPKRMLSVSLDGGKPINLRVSNTGSWGIFETSLVDLPPIKAGDHSIRVETAEPDNTANVDTLVLFEGDSRELPVSLRGSVVAESGHYRIATTPDAALDMSLDEITRSFEVIYEYYKNYFGWTPPGQITIWLIGPDLWKPGWSAHQNGEGIFLPSAAMRINRGNWMHEMAHVFFCGHVPAWVGETLVRVLTLGVWEPRVFPGTMQTAADHKRYMLQGHDVLDNPDKQFDSLEPVLVAFMAKYGEDFYYRFLHNCLDAGKKNEIDFRHEHSMTTKQFLRLMSKTAGEDVTPLFRRWKGFNPDMP